MHSPRTSTRPR